MPPAAVGCPTARPPLTTLLAALALLLTLIVTPAARAQNCDPGWLPGAGATGMNDWVFALAVLPGGDLITGGQFTTAGGVGANRIARYNTTTGVWSALGSGMNSSVSGFAALPVGDVIVGGYFTRAGGVAANRIARYNPTTGVWSALGSGMNDYVYAFAFLPGGDLITGGYFSTAGGVAANRIARYNPTTGVWSALGTGVNNGPVVYALADLPGGDVIAGGNFTTAGGSASAYFARYSFGIPAPTITGQPEPQTVCPSGTAPFSITASGTGPFTYQWQLQTAPPPANTWATLGNNPTPLPCGGSGHATPPNAAATSIAITPCPGVNHYQIRCVVSNVCGSVTSNPATLTLCPADFNCDGATDFFDYDDFVTCFEGVACPPGKTADFNHDTAIDFFDYDDFVVAFEAGC